MTIYKSNFPDGFISSATPSVISIVAINVEQFTLTLTDISNGYIDLAVVPERADTVQLDWEGVVQYDVVDYTITGNRITFEAELLSLLVTGDIIKVSYQ